MSFIEATRQATAFHSDYEGQDCGGQWGQPPPPCGEEAIVCSLCEGAEDACAL